MKVSESEAFEKALNSGARKGEETFMVFTARKDREFIEFETLEDVELPDKLKGKILLRQASLSPQQRQMVLTWTEMSDRDPLVVTSLRKLDNPLFVGRGRDSMFLEGQVETVPEETFVNEEEEWGEVFFGSDPYLSYYEDERNDVGEDSEDDEFVWVLASDLAKVHDERDLEESFAQFRQVKKGLLETRKARGFFQPWQMMLLLMYDPNAHWRSWIRQKEAL